MTSQQVILTNCIPTGRIPITNVQNGQAWTRDWEFIFNSDPQITGLDMGAVFDDSFVRSGVDGQFRVGGILVGEITQFSAWMDAENQPVRVLGRMRIGTRMTGYTGHLTFTELVMRDARILLPILYGAGNPGASASGGLLGGRQFPLSFQGTIYDDTDQRSVS